MARVLHLTTVGLSLRVLLAYQLRAFEQVGYEVLGASAPDEHVGALAEIGVRHVPVAHLTRRWAPLEDARALVELVAIFRRERPDIVHTHNPKSGVLGRVAARIAGVPVVVNTVHGLYANPAMPPVKRGIARIAERGAAKLSHHEFFQSAEDLRYAVGTHMVPSSRASHLGNGVDLSRFDPGMADAKAVAHLRERWEIGEGELVVGSVGRLVREKGFPELFEAAERLASTHPEVRVVVVGPEEPDKPDRLSASEVARGRAAGVVFHGEGTDMPTTYAAFDAFVLASHREGMPRSAIEASAMGLPVVATDIRGCREVVTDGESGRLVPVRAPAALATAIGELASDPSERARMGAAGRRRAAERFDERKVVERELEVYERLLAARRSTKQVSA